jgi:hypothetical protein
VQRSLKAPVEIQSPHNHATARQHTLLPRPKLIGGGGEDCRLAAGPNPLRAAHRPKPSEESDLKAQQGMAMESSL